MNKYFNIGARVLIIENFNSKLPRLINQERIGKIPKVVPKPYSPPLGLKLTWDNIANVPVEDPSDVVQWNTFFGSGNLGTAFISLSVSGNTVTLIGGKNVSLKSNLFVGVFSKHLISVIDEANCVNSVGIGCFSDSIYYINFCNHLTTVILPACTSVSDNSFSYCTSLVNTNFDSLETAGNSSFNNCASLLGFNAPTATFFGTYCFYGCEKLITVTAPNLITAGEGCFSNTKAAIYYNFPNLIYAGGSCFKMNYDSSLLNINLPLVTSIGDYCFNGCMFLNTLYIPNCTSLGTDPTINNDMFEYIEHDILFSALVGGVPSGFYPAIEEGLSTISGSTFNYTTGRFTTPTNYLTVTVPSSLLTDNNGSLNACLYSLLSFNSYQFYNTDAPIYPPVPDWSTLPNTSPYAVGCGFNIKIFTELGEFIPNVPFNG